MDELTLNVSCIHYPLPISFGKGEHRPWDFLFNATITMDCHNRTIERVSRLQEQMNWLHASCLSIWVGTIISYLPVVAGMNARAYGVLTPIGCCCEVGSSTVQGSCIEVEVSQSIRSIVWMLESEKEWLREVVRRWEEQYRPWPQLCE